jgi:hypothetical protein
VDGADTLVVVVSSSTSKTTTTTTRQAFAQVIAPLEKASNRRLGNPARDECFESFLKYPDGVREQARSALFDTDGRNALGLFVWRIKRGWHELEPFSADGETVSASEFGRGTPRDRPKGAQCFALLVDRGDGTPVVRETFKSRHAYESRAAELERELGPHNVTRLAA